VRILEEVLNNKNKWIMRKKIIQRNEEEVNLRSLFK